MPNPEQALWQASRGNNLPSLLHLLQTYPSLNPNWANPAASYTSALHVAAKEGHVRIVEVLMAVPAVDLNRVNINGSSPLLCAVWGGQPEVLRIFLKDPQVDVNLPDSRGATPLWLAASLGQLYAVQLLLSFRVNVNPHIGAVGGGTPLDVARRKRRTQVAELLERFMADPDRTRRELRLDPRLAPVFATELFASLVFLCDGHLALQH